MKRCIVIGLGIFGNNIVRELADKGFEVIAIDKSKEAVQRVRDLASKAIVADGTDKEIMAQIGIQEDDTVIISFGEDLAACHGRTVLRAKFGVRNRRYRSRLRRLRFLCLTLLRQAWLRPLGI